MLESSGWGWLFTAEKTYQGKPDGAKLLISTSRNCVKLVENNSGHPNSMGYGMGPTSTVLCPTRLLNSWCVQCCMSTNCESRINNGRCTPKNRAKINPVSRLYTTCSALIHN